jgi:hypothetical protein
MQLPTIPKIGRLSTKRKITAAGSAAAAALVLTVTGLQATGGTAVASSAPTGRSASVSATAQTTGTAAQQAVAGQAGAQHQAADTAARNKAVAAATRTAQQAADRSEQRGALVAQPASFVVKNAAPAAAKTYSNNLDGWIKQSLDILAAHHIPASYDGIHRNIIRESSGNPKAINLWDINARNGIPSKGLLQVIDPTFRAYHVAGTSWDIYNPVSNITAACNYAFHKYGSMDNVNSAY